MFDVVLAVLVWGLSWLLWFGWVSCEIEVRFCGVLLLDDGGSGRGGLRCGWEFLGIWELWCFLLRCSRWLFVESLLQLGHPGDCTPVRRVVRLRWMSIVAAEHWGILAQGSSISGVKGTVFCTCWLPLWDSVRWWLKPKAAATVIGCSG